jgi:hypothetical protein
MVDMPGMSESIVKIRRGRRTDLPALVELCASTTPTPTDKTQARHWRRLASDPNLDFYVAEQHGAIVGALLICYIRSLREQGWRAVLDIAFLASSSCTLGQELLTFAKARARQRGCRQLIAGYQEAADNGRLAALTQGGFLPVGEVLSCEL